MLKRAIGISIFFLLFISIYGGMNYFVYSQIVSYFEFQGTVKLLLQLVFWIVGASYMLTRILKKFKYTFVFSYIGSVWMGLLSISVFVLIIKMILLYIINDYHHQINTTAWESSRL